MIDENMKDSDYELTEDTFVGFNEKGEKKLFYKDDLRFWWH